MNAAISGRAGMALLIEGDSLMSFDVDDPDTLVPRQQAELHFLFGDAIDLQFIEDIDREQAAQELKRAHDSACALDLALITLDPELSDEVRKEAAQELDELLIDADVVRDLEAILYGRPLPREADIEGALRHCEESQAANALDLLRRLEKYQPAIRQVCRAWQAIPENFFGGIEERSEFHRVAIREGLFSGLAFRQYLRGRLGIYREFQVIENFLIVSLLNPSVQAMRNYRDALQEWVKPFRETSKPLSLTPYSKEELGVNRLPKEKRKKGPENLDRATVRENEETPSTTDISAEASWSPAAIATPTAEAIECRAYEIYLARGDGEGSTLEDWLQAERELLGIKDKKINRRIPK